ncbi:MAG TPA: hypothetical protein DD379_18705 [Cyanobacteria bacterium UBA11162]|nr:hypothetical protein [Cyanobacteria bacterium UBA12227]HAX88801.1 hypothetical protein [Cyanobacteria bacterium UBA11370]HBL13388.1 hypothetical protein [Cyanobacteria bacterium UBA11162]HBY75607.1 hypothetical protein [Cyanobacteria bacterium UBA11148]
MEDSEERKNREKEMITLQERQVEGDRKAFKVDRRRTFQKHLVAYLAVNTFLLICRCDV